MTTPLSSGLALSAARLSSASHSRAYSRSINKLASSYFIPRNCRGSLPVYSDIRNGRTRYLILVKNIRGNIHLLRDDLASSLFASGSEHSARLNAQVSRPDTLVVTGGRWKNNVTEWLRQKGF